MDILSEFSERLSELMFFRGIKSEKLGKDLGIGGSTIRRWIRKDSKINLPNLLKLADYFKCTMDFFAGRSEGEMKFTPLTPPPFPQALRKSMDESGYTRYKLDKTTRFKNSYLYKWDHGSQPDIFSLVELADIFGVTIDHLVGREK